MSRDPWKTVDFTPDDELTQRVNGGEPVYADDPTEPFYAFDWAIEFHQRQWFLFILGIVALTILFASSVHLGLADGVKFSGIGFVALFFQQTCDASSALSMLTKGHAPGWNKACSAIAWGIAIICALATLFILVDAL
jgi:hypothetical protein